MAETQEKKLAQRRNDDCNWIKRIEVMLGSIDHQEVQACSISAVSDRIRSSKEEAYSPKAVSIGPLHKAAKKNLQLMEELKWRYTLSLLARTGETDEEQAWRVTCSALAMLELDNIPRASYGGAIKFEPKDLATIMLVDGCFVLELLFRLNNLWKENDLRGGSFNDPMLFGSKEKFFSVLNDLTMLENQVPFIVLKTLYRKVVPSDIALEDDRRVVELARNAFGYNSVNSSQDTVQASISHILHLIHLSAVLPENNGQVKRACQELECCATRLLARGITLRPIHSNSKNCWFTDKFEFKITLQKKEGKLEVPPLHIKETTETNWRNLIAWEQGRNGTRPKFTSYALFFQGLICCEQDVELLLQNKIIINEVRKSKEELLTFFRTITEGVEDMDSSHSELCEALKNQPVRVLKLKKLSIIIWHRCRFISVREQIPTVWKFIGVLATTLLLALIIEQTYCTASCKK